MLCRKAIFRSVFWLVLLSMFVTLASSWMIWRTPEVSRSCIRQKSRHTPLYSNSPSIDPNTRNAILDTKDDIIFRASTASGLTDTELSLVLEGIEDTFKLHSEEINVDIISQFNVSSIIKLSADPIKSCVFGALGRILLLETNLPMEGGDNNALLEVIQYLIAQKLDHFLYEEAILKQPILISIQPWKDSLEGSEDTLNKEVIKIVQNQVLQFEMCQPLLAEKSHSNDEATIVPTIQVEMDGAYVSDESSTPSKEVWDTSSILVFDDLVSEELRKSLLDVTLGRSNKDEAWDDTNGPDPSRWVKGGLIDIPDEEEDGSSPMESSSWGLSDEAVEDLCFQRHDAIEEFEKILSNLFPQFTVTRLPEAVFGSSVSPLTANAPTVHDSFDYHIDGDPNLTPPSPWTDVYGRYPNRIQGKPRFMSCLIYLNDEWNDEWGAPTRFLDLPTNEFYEVFPRPGRCVFMDQDVSHTVVAPNISAGNRPRYSLVWKLVLHPKAAEQEMTNLAGSKVWPEPTLFGSAKRSNAHEEHK